MKYEPQIGDVVTIIGQPFPEMTVTEVRSGECNLIWWNNATNTHVYMNGVPSSILHTTQLACNADLQRIEVQKLREANARLHEQLRETDMLLKQALSGEASVSPIPIGAVVYLRSDVHGKAYDNYPMTVIGHTSDGLCICAGRDGGFNIEQDIFPAQALVLGRNENNE